MSNVVFLQDLVVVMLAASFTAMIFHLLKLPKILGYILAGLIIASTALPFPLIRNEASILPIADMGVAFLMFSLGMEFNLRRLRSVGISAGVVAFVDVIFMFWLGFTIGRVLGWTTVESLFLGGIICDSSTTVVSKMLAELDKARQKYTSLIIGATIVEDLLAVALIAILSGVGITGTVQPEHVMERIGQLIAFLVTLLVVGLLGVRRLVNLVSRTDNNEILLMTVLGICFGVCLITVKMQFSLALGAFIIGAVMAEATASSRIHILTQSLRDLFGPVFFVAIGMLLDPALVIQYGWQILLITATVIIGKTVAAGFGAWLAGNDRLGALTVGCGMAQICEFSLIIASLAVSLKAVGPQVYPIAVSVSVLTIIINPFLLRSSNRLYTFLDRFTPPAMAGTTTFYTRWLTNARRQPTNDVIRRSVIRSLVIIGINLALIAAIFITVAYLARIGMPMPFSLPDYLGGTDGILWMLGALVTIPLYVATLRKMNALCMIMAEMRFPIPATGGMGATIARNLTEKILLLFGVVVLGLFTLLLTSALLPPLPVLLLFTAVLILLTIFFWKFNVRIYSNAQTALRQVFSEEKPAFNIDTAAAMPYAFREARVSTLLISPDSPAVGRSVRKLALRNRSGATIVGIKRAGQLIVNPPSNELIQAGDSLMFLGLQAQLDEAEKLLSGASRSDIKAHV